MCRASGKYCLKGCLALAASLEADVRTYHDNISDRVSSLPVRNIICRAGVRKEEEVCGNDGSNSFCGQLQCSELHTEFNKSCMTSRRKEEGSRSSLNLRLVLRASRIIHSQPLDSLRFKVHFNRGLRPTLPGSYLVLKI